jgi:LysM repeat protein
MSTPNSPLLPGSKLEQAAKSKSTFSIAAFIFSAHVAVFLVVLLNGCNKESSVANTEPAAATNQTDLAVQPGFGAVDTNAPVQPTGLDTNTVATPPGGAVTFPGNLAISTNPPALPIAPPELGVSTPGGSTINDTTGAGSEYKIKSGDIAYNIAKTHGVSLKALKDANPSVDLGKLKVGQTIQIPAAGASNPKTAATTLKSDSANEPAATGTTTAYTVKGGDTLSKIAKKHGTTPKAIRAANGLSSDKINVGQKLKIPGKSATTETAEPATKAPIDALPTLPPPTLPPAGTGR